MPRTRRAVLTVASSLGLASVAGCLGDGDDESASVPDLDGSPSRTATLLAEDGEVQNFGEAVALDDGTALVGAGSTGSTDGSAYVFAESDGGWEQRAGFDVADGAAVGLDGDAAVVSGAGDAVHVFERTGGSWNEEAQFPVADDRSVESIVAEGDTALVGHFRLGTDDVPVDVLERSEGSWSRTGSLTPADGLGSDRFGPSVALDGDTALVGAHSSDATPDPGQGGVYVFERDGGTWSEQALLGRDSPRQYDEFGTAVALSGDRALIGMVAGHERDSNVVYVYERTGGAWEERAALTPNGSASSFGEALALAGSTALVGAPGASNQTGDTFVFRASEGSWSQTSKLTGSDGAFGRALSISADTALVGNAGDDTDGEGAGAAYVYE